MIIIKWIQSQSPGSTDEPQLSSQGSLPEELNPDQTMSEREKGKKKGTENEQK
jgi:hypothetical protein